MARRVITRGPRRKTVWARSINNIAVTGAGAPGQTDMLQAYRAAGGDTQGATVGRILLRVYSRLIDATPNFTSQALVFGVYVQRTTAAAISPNVDLHSDWMLWASLPVKTLRNATGTVTGTEDMVYDYDLRGKRKLDELQNSVFFSNVSAVNDYELQVTASILLLLP